MNESLNLSIDSFLTMVSVEKGLAKNTVEAYSRDLVRLAEFLDTQGIQDWTRVDAILQAGLAHGVKPPAVTGDYLVFNNDIGC